MSEAVVSVDALTRRFGATTALDSVSLSLPRGAVYGLVGANGAGKTTLIKHVLGLLRAETGSVRVFGLDPVADPRGVLSRTGYLSEENDLPGWMRVGDLLRYTRAFYPTWSDAYAEQLRRAFALDGSTKIGSLSRGQKARAGLLVALSHRPQLLLLDEPSSGLDPVVRRDILEAILRTITDEGRTVLFSSHLLEEVERVADHVTLISRGRIVLSAPLAEVKDSYRRLTVRFPASPPEPPRLAFVLRWEADGADWTALCRGDSGALEAELVKTGARVVGSRVPTLDEIFVALVGARADHDPEA